VETIAFLVRLRKREARPAEVPGNLDECSAQVSAAGYLPLSRDAVEKHRHTRTSRQAPPSPRAPRRRRMSEARAAPLEQRRTTMNAMRSIARRGLGAAALLVLAGCASAGVGTGTAAAVDLRLDPAEWTLARRSGDAAVTMLEYVPPGESADDWTRFVSVQTFAQSKVPWPGADRAMTECRLLLQARCPGATWTVLRESADDALYEWRIAGCPGEPDQHEVGRIVRSGRTWSRVTFSVKGEMDAATREAWIRRLEEAR
jgi:hypothetical protein